ncbi:MAG TPA: hypothetical protein VK689_06505 [Armatimonadota bacterium]|nr:hypothetical protein [Armatimonadota bacterium]
MDRSSRNRWGNTAVLTAALATGLYLFSSSQALGRIEGVSTTAGDSIALFARDSAVVILFTTAECPISRANAHWYRELGTRLRGEGVAFRTVVRSSAVSARQFARLLGDPAAAHDDGTLFRAADVRSVPVLRLYDAQRRLLASWSSPTASIGIENVLGEVVTRTGPQSER